MVFSCPDLFSSVSQCTNTCNWTGLNFETLCFPVHQMCLVKLNVSLWEISRRSRHKQRSHTGTHTHTHTASSIIFIYPQKTSILTQTNHCFVSLFIFKQIQFLFDFFESKMFYVFFIILFTHLTQYFWNKTSHTNKSIHPFFFSWRLFCGIDLTELQGCTLSTMQHL